MSLIYSLLLTIGFIVLLPRFLYDVLVKGKYAAGFSQRLGNLPELRRGGRPVIWLHCVSVGETHAALPLAREILKLYPDYCLVVSTTTDTGQAAAEKVFGGIAEMVFYFPFDWQFSVRRALRIIRPNVVLIMETELWFNFIRESRKSGAVVAIVNGRISKESLKRYSWVKGFLRRIFHYVDLALMQGRKDAMRIVELGMRPSKVKITGNIKFDQQAEESESEITAELRTRFAISKDVPLIVAASTHAPEEQWILDAFKQVYKEPLDELPRLLIAPRHPDRFPEVAELIEATGFTWTKRTNAPSADDELTDVILLDSIGELRAVFPLAELVFVGGSLIPHGGQNVLEPAAAKKPIITGHHTSNFEWIVKEFVDQRALIQLPELDGAAAAGTVAEVFIQLLKDPGKREQLAANAFGSVEQNRGATKKTVEFLRNSLTIQSGKPPE